MQGLFNFKPSVRPVPLECHIQGYPGKFYCPRMATMNKPAYAAIQLHSPLKPVRLFFSIYILRPRCFPNAGCMSTEDSSVERSLSTIPETGLVG